MKLSRNSASNVRFRRSVPASNPRASIPPHDKLLRPQTKAHSGHAFSNSPGFRERYERAIIAIQKDYVVALTFAKAGVACCDYALVLLANVTRLRVACGHGRGVVLRAVIYNMISKWR